MHAPVRYRFGDFELDIAERSLARCRLPVLEGQSNGHPERVSLQPKTFDLLAHLVTHAGKLHTKQALLNEVWGDVVVTENSLTRSISQLRTALDDPAEEPRFVETIPRVGYRFIAAVTQQHALVPATVPPAGELVPPEQRAGLPQPRFDGDSALAEGVLVPRRRRVPWWSALAVVSALGLGVMLTWTTWWSPHPHITNTPRQITQTRNLFSPYLSPYPLATDGTRIYFNEWLNGDHAMRQISVRGGEAAALDPPFAIGQHRLIWGMTPDRAELLVNAEDWSSPGEGRYWLWSPAGGSPRRFMDSQVGHEISWSADGETLVHVTGSDVFLARGDGTESRKLFEGPGRVYWPRISPDGRRIRFTVRGPSSFSIWEASIDGSNVRQLLPGWNNPSDECCGSWTPDGKYYVFQATRDHRAHIWMLPERTGPMSREAEPVQLTTGTMDFIRPLIAPEGHTIYAIGWYPRGEVRRFDAGTGRFVTHGFPRSAEWLAYSRDGSRVAYVTYPEAELWRSRSTGENPLQLTRTPMKVHDPWWSPDGETLAFRAQLPGQRGKIYLADANGASAPRPLTTLDRAEGFPSWSPDGSSLAFNTDDGIRVIELATGTETPLEGAEHIYQPRWSHDGRFISGVAFDDDHPTLMLFDVSTRRWEALAPAPGFWYHQWSPDERYIYFLTEDPASELYRVDMVDRTVELVLSFRQEPWVYGMRGLWFGFDPDGAPLYLHDQSISYIYALDWKD